MTFACDRISWVISTAIEWMIHLMQKRGLSEGRAKCGCSCIFAELACLVAVHSCVLSAWFLQRMIWRYMKGEDRVEGVRARITTVVVFQVWWIYLPPMLHRSWSTRFMLNGELTQMILILAWDRIVCFDEALWLARLDSQVLRWRFTKVPSFRKIVLLAIENLRRLVWMTVWLPLHWRGPTKLGKLAISTPELKKAKDCG